MTDAVKRKRPRRASIHTVAEAAGVAPSTVSRYLNGKLAIAAETAERITAAVEELGYKKPPLMEKVASKLVAIVVPHVDIAYFSDLAERTTEAVERFGMESIICTTGSRGFGAGGLVDQLLALPVGGVVFAGTNRHSGGLRKLHEAGIPIVAIAEKVQDLAVDGVRVDYHSGAHQAVAYLASHGHQNIGMIAGPDWLESNQASLRGFDEAMLQSGLEPRDDLKLFGEISRDFGYAAMSRLMLTPDRPTAIYVTADEIALGIYSAARDLGLDLPKDLSIVGSDDIPVAQFLTPALTSVRLPRDRMADRAVELLRSRMSGEDARREVSDLILPVSLQVRSSVASPPM